jgi:hypothetical protein
MVDAQALSILFAGLSIAASIIYYANILTNANKTRKAQFIHQITAWRQDPERWKINYELLTMQWDDYDDFVRKYSPSNDLDHASRRNSFLYALDTWGHLVKEAKLDRELVYDVFGRGVISIWEKHSPIIREYRTRLFNNDDSYMSGFENLYNEMVIVRERKGIIGKPRL